MAFENTVWLNGIIRKVMVKYNAAKTDYEKIVLAVEVMRRTRIAYGNRKGKNKYDIVMVNVTDKGHIKESRLKNAAVSSAVEVYGKLTSQGIKKTYRCMSCDEVTEYMGNTMYVYPLSFTVADVKPRTTEVIWLTHLEEKGSREEILSILKSRKVSKGEILKVKNLGEGADGFYRHEILTGEQVTPADISDWMEQKREISNHIHIMGNLCADPTVKKTGAGSLICIYKLAIKRDVKIKDPSKDQESPENPENDALPGLNEEMDPDDEKTDYIWVQTYGKHAEQDLEVLRKGSSVFIDGSIQGRSDISIHRICENCHCGILQKDSAMEIVPYKVEYLRNCLLPPREESSHFKQEESVEWEDF